jgi:nickel-dependent lactate racemase
MLGNDIVSRFRIVQNDALDRESHIPIGTTSSGNDIWIHKDFVSCDAKILTGFIEPHFFAGFSGGGKACMPGLALLETIFRNHSARNLDNPSTTWGITRGNPLWEEVQEAAELLGSQFLLNVSLNRDKQITGVFAGRLDKAHRAGCAFVKEKAMIPVAEPFDIVITSNSGYPLDLNLYQSVKGMSAAAQIVKPGGAIIIAADCWDGIPDHGEYGKLLREADSLESLLATMRKPGFQRQDMWQAHIQALIRLKAEVYVYSHNLSDQQIQDAFFAPCRDIEALVARQIDHIGGEARICVLPEGPQTIPYLLKPGSTMKGNPADHGRNSAEKPRAAPNDRVASNDRETSND